MLGHVGTFLLSATVIALFWRAHHSVLREAEWIHGTLFWCNVAFLALISLIPFPTRVLADYGDRHLGPGLYGGVIGTPSALDHGKYAAERVRPRCATDATRGPGEGDPAATGASQHPAGSLAATQR